MTCSVSCRDKCETCEKLKHLFGILQKINYVPGDMYMEDEFYYLWNPEKAANPV